MNPVRNVRPPADTAAEPAQAETFERLVAGYGRLIAEAVRRVAGRSAAGDLEDIQQDVMLALWKRVAGEQAIEHPSSYLYTMSIREAVRATRLRFRRRERPLDESPVQEPKVDADAESALALREATSRLHAVVDTLAPDRARAVRSYLAGLSVEETMHLYGWSYQRARNLLARGIGDVKLRMMEPSKS